LKSSDKEEIFMMEKVGHRPSFIVMSFYLKKQFQRIEIKTAINSSTINRRNILRFISTSHDGPKITNCHMLMDFLRAPGHILSQAAP